MSKDWTEQELRAASAAMKKAGQMSYEEMLAVLAEQKKASEIILAFAADQVNRPRRCPRCGKLAMDPEDIHRNALSRYADVMICDSCGTDEAMRDFVGEVLPISEWHIVKHPKEYSA